MGVARTGAIHRTRGNGNRMAGPTGAVRSELIGYGCMVVGGLVGGVGTTTIRDHKLSERVGTYTAAAGVLTYAGLRRLVVADMPVTRWFVQADESIVRGIGQRIPYAGRCAAGVATFGLWGAALGAMFVTVANPRTFAL